MLNLSANVLIKFDKKHEKTDKVFCWFLFQFYILSVINAKNVTIKKLHFLQCSFIKFQKSIIFYFDFDLVLGFEAATDVEK